MGMDWYDMIALRNGGYKGRSTYTWEGQSAEDIFEERLIRLLSQHQSVLDAGCGDGDFTLKMSAHARHITGFDNSKELLYIEWWHDLRHTYRRKQGKGTIAAQPIRADRD
ncbi:protein arginine N-methyltransferase 2 [Paenibacillus sp. 7516]|uniref:class I SAM-dependent methyltransferase n=1 Tax=Paenibacillus sp. 7516 TaxID=2022549 RepID=UPI0020167C8A|nr:protein arginine N-methyltransferase 2 [Paenibacillus sp. 7516]